MIVTQVAWILEEVHNSGVVYRDIKASNFMLDKDGRVKMIDLGLAKKIDKKRTYSICGTVHAMPPEILLQTSK
jgi:serine/threonine protein kinase